MLYYFHISALLYNIEGDLCKLLFTISDNLYVYVTGFAKGVFHVHIMPILINHNFRIEMAIGLKFGQ